MTTTEKLYEAAINLPESAIAELLDFAEFLREKARHERVRAGSELLVDLKGGLESSSAFAEDPSLIQKRLRDEWN